MWKTRWRWFESWHVIFFYFFFLSVYVWKCDEGFVLLLHIVAKSLSAFPNKWTNTRRGEQTILNKYNKFG